jgi:hypothetical protein
LSTKTWRQLVWNRFECFVLFCVFR